MASPTSSGTLQLFTFAGIRVSVHWSWAVVALLEMQWRADVYDSMLWNLVEYIGLFAIVLLHEFGHALACRSVGGRAEQIMLWPLGGVAYVQPPQRPGALLWSIAAGPLVNLILAAIGFALMIGFPGLPPDLDAVLVTFITINVALFVFNMLPVYPLDGGQIVRALLWFVIGRERSLTVAAGLGLVASVLGGIAAVVWLGSWWLGLIALYAAWQSWRGLQAAQARTALLNSPRHDDLHCPACGESPIAGPYWRCSQQHQFDLFTADGVCPECGEHLPETPCVFCGDVRPIQDYRSSSA